MNELRNQRIIANAGSGKTYRLVSRYLELLKREVPAERIVALTFTRKSAGEFLDRIFQRLLAGTEKGDSGSGLSAEECSRYLRELVDKMPRLTLGTLDSFFGRMVRAFPFECGLAGDITIMDGHALNTARREALDALFRGHADEASFAAFLDLIRQQNRNAEGRDVTETLGREIDALHEGFLMTPDGVTWGDSRAIWPQGNAFLGREEAGSLAETFDSVVFDEHSDMDDKYRAHWENLLAEVRLLRRGASVPENVVKFAVRALDPPPAPKDPGSFYLTVFGNKRFVFPDRHRDLVVALGRAVLRVELDGRLARSRALYDLVERFERPYQELVRDAGRLTFADITGLLAAADGAAWKGGAVTGFDRQAMDFRLDATYDHWLLDEFQDTSRLQWQALRNLVDEVVQSDTGRRSFFYVGDTKQAIYTWRGGDPWLFDEIAEFYNASGTERIDTSESLDISYRSVPEILQTVNALFDPGHLGRLQDSMRFPTETLQRWASAWREHKPHDTQSGFVQWRAIESGDEGRKEALDRETARLIAGIDPIARGYTCAVLVKSNLRAGSVLDALNAAGLEARSEGRFNPCTDNDPGAVLLSLLRAVAHPSDEHSKQHVLMTPLREVIGGDFEAFRLAALRKIREHGFAGAIAEWSGHLALSGNPFARDRVGDFFEAAEEFDAASCGGTIDEFTGFMANRESSDDPSVGSIRVLTVHAAKGLDFDMVVIPDGDEGVMASRRDNAPVHLHTQRDGRIVWGLDLPSRLVCDVEPTLAVAYETALAGDTYENLCLYYVAATRAKKALYILSEKMPESSSARSFTRLLRETLPTEGGVYSSGDENWYVAGQSRSRPASREVAPLNASPYEEVRPDRPSEQTEFHRYEAARLLSAEHGLSVGREVHRALSRVEWNDQRLPSFEDIPPEAANLARQFLSSPVAAEIFRRPESAFTLWRERAFEVMIGDRPVSGIFDRVVISATGAEIFDYKLDGDAVDEVYNKQMSLYRQALSALTGLSETKISVSLVVLKTACKTRLEI